VLNTRYENIYSNNSPIPTGVNAVNVLPSGFSIDRNTCVVTVDINQPGTYSAYVGIDIPGYYSTSGSSGLSALTVPFSITIDGPLLTLSLSVNTYTWGESISKNLSTDLKLTGISLASSDVVEYVGTYAGLPVSAQGLVSGVAKEATPQSASISAKITRNGRVFYSSKAIQTLSMFTPAVTIPDQIIASGASLLPQSNGLLPSDIVSYSAGYAYSAPCDKPKRNNTDNSYLSLTTFASTAPFSVNASTGAIKGNGTAGKYCVPLVMTVTRNGILGTFEAYKTLEFR
jgi:hypothetical protein